MENTATVFIDRDGVINRTTRGKWVNSADDLEVYPFAAEAIKMLNDAGATVIIITNQSGVVLGYLPHHEYYAITAKMLKTLNDGGAKITRIYECLHPKNPVTCMCRKPDAGMIYKAIEDYPTTSPKWLIGDCASDIETAYRAINHKITPIMVRTGLNDDNELAAVTKLAETYGRDFYLEQNLLYAARRIVQSVSS